MVVSNDSTIEIRSTRSEMPAVTIANSWMNPGLMPLPKIVAVPRSHASATRDLPSPRRVPLMNSEVVTTLMPAPRMRTISSTSANIGLYTTQSGASASSASTSSVAVTPRGVMPQSSPTSLPTLSGDHA